MNADVCLFLGGWLFVLNFGFVLLGGMGEGMGGGGKEGGGVVVDSVFCVNFNGYNIGHDYVLHSMTCCNAVPNSRQ